ncbi:MAG: 23S rRNA (adenine(2030)-N(6))-methyltransferase RlmJ [Pseudomonadales bacterium]|nr:23S rRNA (adenine(2030)-N(6))-methyltransferase RlmJ [Pseudomonadales bacterium]
MLSYQHGFHAGNVADVLKHAVLCHVIDYLLQKDKPLYFHDTHAGRGMYDLAHPVAQKTAEYRDGIERVWFAAAMSTDAVLADTVPDALLPYLTALRSFNADGRLRRYAGSTALAHSFLRDSDRLFASELHPQEFSALQTCAALWRNVRVSKEDGYAALKAALPPKERRGVVLLDPSYETLADDAAVVDSLAEALKRFATGVYLLWYPIVDATRTKKMLRKLAALPTDNILRLELMMREPNGQGMAGSGMVVINPPWLLEGAMRVALPWLVQQLAPADGFYVVDQLTL